MADPAPFHAEVADGPEGGTAFWLRCDDGIRIRVAHWSHPTPRGTVLMLPGRTEYIEKYGRTARDFALHGLAMASIDWRGQGLADRLTTPHDLGHVRNFRDYQLDLAALIDAAEDIGLERPFFLLGHSMGGAIGLRALVEKVDIRAAAFSAPMWGIGLGPLRRPAGWVITDIARRIGFDAQFAPGTIPQTYVLANPFEDNMLTTDRDMFDYMKTQVTTHPELALGGPSMLWVNEALRECRALAAHPSPKFPTITFLGTNERIVDSNAVHDRMARWPDAALHMIEGAEHEVLMERAPIRQRITEQIAQHFLESPVQDAH